LNALDGKVVEEVKIFVGQDVSSIEQWSNPFTAKVKFLHHVDLLAQFLPALFRNLSRPKGLIFLLFV